jgi:hypothetical protein
MLNKVIFPAALVWLLISTSLLQAQKLVFIDDFDGGQVIAPGVSGGFSGFVSIEPAQGFAGLGTEGNVASGSFLHNPTGDAFTNTPSEKTTLTLTGLRAHSAIQLRFLLSVIDTWDGESGSDTFHVDVDGESAFAESFSNFSAFLQSYEPAPGVLIAGNTDLGFEVYSDSLYDLGLDTARFGSISHSSGSVQIDFYANGFFWNRPANESWAVENVAVLLLGVPEPATIAQLMLLVVGGLVLRGRR